MSPISRRQALAALGGSLLAGCLSRSAPDSLSGRVEAGPGAVSATVQSPPAPGTWPMARRDAAATASAPAANGPTTFPLEEVWTHETEQSAMRPAVVGDGTLLALTSNPDANLAALDPVTGTVRWSVTHDRLGHATPALADDRAFVPWGYYQTGEYIDALALEEGARVWRATVGEAPATDLVHVGDTVYGVLESNQTLIALSATTGDLALEFALSEPAFRIPRLAVADGTVYAAVSGMETDYPDVGFVVAIDPVGGEIRWIHEAEFPVADLSVAEGAIYAGSGAGLAALDAETGDVSWSVDPFDGAVKRVAIRDGVVVGGTFKGARAFDATSGDPRWHHGSVGSDRGLVIAGDDVYMAGKVWDGDSKWGVESLALGSGSVRWRQVPSPKPRSISVAAGRLYLGTDDGRLLAYA